MLVDMSNQKPMGAVRFILDTARRLSWYSFLPSYAPMQNCRSASNCGPRGAARRGPGAARRNAGAGPAGEAAGLAIAGVAIVMSLASRRSGWRPAGPPRVSTPPAPRDADGQAPKRCESDRGGPRAACSGHRGPARTARKASTSAPKLVS